MEMKITQTELEFIECMHYLISSGCNDDVVSNNLGKYQKLCNKAGANFLRCRGIY